MKFIADTQAFLWFVTDAPLLSFEAKNLLESAENDRLLSIASVWEMAIKANLGRLSFDRPFEEFLPQEITTNRFDLLPIAMNHALRVANMPLHHRDPFDRMIVAQALCESLPVLSNDRALDAYGIQRLW